MKNLAQHIESLIIKHECVIVPGLGGFLTYRDRAIVRNNRLYAPTERIRFNSLLTYQDGLLAEAYMRDRNIGYTEALDAINTEVEQIKKSLNGGSTVLFGRIGALSISAENNIMLLNSNPKFLPENIGLPVVHLKQLASAKPANTITISIPQTSTNVLRYVASIAIIFLVTLFIPNPTGYDTQRASLSFDSIRNIKNLEYSDECLENNDLESDANRESTAKTPIATETAFKTPINNAQPSHLNSKYHLIIASLTSQEDAEEYIANHTQFDRSQLQIIESKGKYRISAAGFDKYKDALQYMDSIRNEVPIAKKAWIMCK